MSSHISVAAFAFVLIPVYPVLNSILSSGLNPFVFLACSLVLLTLLCFAYAFRDQVLADAEEGRCYESVTWCFAGPDLGKFPTARRLRRRIAGRTQVNVVQARPGFWHVVPEVTGWTLDDVPDTHRVGADAAISAAAELRWARAEAHRAFKTTVEKRRYALSGALAGEAHLDADKLSVSYELTASDISSMTFDSVSHARAWAEARAATVTRQAFVATPKRGMSAARSGLDLVQAAVKSMPPPAKARRLVHEGVMTARQWVRRAGAEQWHTLDSLDLAVDATAEQVPGIDHFIPMTATDAVEASRVFNTAPDTLGEQALRMDTALAIYKKGVATSVPPSDPAYTTLLRLLGPLAFRPKIEGHKAAQTLRRGALAQASRALEGAIVGLVSPSHAEMHTFPNAAIWRYNDGAVDFARSAKHCTYCKQPTCAVLAAAGRDGRVLVDNNFGLAAKFFKRFSVQSLLLLNIEPNISSRDLLDLMVDAGVANAYSLTSVDWRALVVPEVMDQLIDMTTSRDGDYLVSSFGDAGEYVQSLAKCQALFRPTFSRGYSLRRTIIFGSDATQYFELNVSASNIATRCVPNHEHYYFIRVPTPEGTDHLVLVERKGFDRVLHTYRTQAIKDLDTAKTCLRQSNVTYSIAGTQVTPRLKLSATEMEALSVWIVVYSQVQDIIAKKTVAAVNLPATTALSQSVWSATRAALTATSGGQIALGTVSAVEHAIGHYRRTIGEKTLDQLSNEAFVELFGSKVSVSDLTKNFLSKWSSWSTIAKYVPKALEKLRGAVISTWRRTFGIADVAVVASLLGLRLTVESLGVLIDLCELVTRVSGMPDATAQVRRLQGALNWPRTKAEHIWTTVQDAQKLDFQAAMIDIIEVMFNKFSVDPAAELRESQEAASMDPEELRILAEAAALPYSDFLSEVKRFLTCYNNRIARQSAVSQLLHRLQQDKRQASPQQLARMVHTLTKEVPQAVVGRPEKLQFSLGRDVETLPIPLAPIMEGTNAQDIRQCFHDRIPLALTPQAGVATSLSRLEVVDGVADFTPIYEMMDVQHPNNVVNPVNFHGPSYITPDARGAELAERLVAHAVTAREGVPFCHRDALEPWYRAQMRSPALIAPVERILRESRNLIDLESQPKWLAHIDGLAMGGKSQGIRSWISNRDLVIVPTNKLKLEWQENLGKADPLRRATVVTQHEALVTKLTAGYVIIDEVYTFDPEHLQMIANRHHASLGCITIGDGHQIGNVFTPTDNHLDTTLAPCTMVSPVSFAPWDAVAVYLEINGSPTRAERYFCGSNTCEGLQYALEPEQMLIPGPEDQAIQGTQAAKDRVKERGLADVITAHESQGSRSEVTVVHAVGFAMQRDIFWLSQPAQYKHLGVTITRARKRTIFVCDGLADVAGFGWVDTGVNGELPNDCLWGGTSWDLVEPNTRDDAKEDYIHEPMLPESWLEERALTDPVTYGTVSCDGEFVAKSEIRAHVELKPGVRFQDLGIKHSDEFDNYTIQPRDVPGVDQIQALTRAGSDIKPTYQDYSDAEHIVNLIFEQVIDPKIFFAHLANTRRNVLNRRDRQQVIDGAYAEFDHRASTFSFAFLKPEFAKKPSELLPSGELKAQGVITASAAQQALFMDSCDALTHAWARAQRQGKFSPVGFKEQDIDSVLSTFETSFELDLEKQDSSHKAVHVLVACRFLELAADKLGLAKVAEEIRAQRTVRMMKDPFSFVLNWSLASGDPWTLIFNKIMAVSSLISVADLTHVRMMQTGDDITMDRKPDFYSEAGLAAQVACNKGLTWKVEQRRQRETGVTFISRGMLPNRQVVYKALRTVLKYVMRPRTRLQQASFRADTTRLLNASARNGLQAYAEARCRVFGGDAAVVYDMWCRAIKTARTPFDELPPKLRDESEKPFQILSKEQGCFGHALAHCVAGNVQAINAIAKYARPTPLQEAIAACKDNGVQYVVIPEKWALRSRGRLSQAIATFDIKLERAFVGLYKDHAVAVKPTSLVTHTGAGKTIFKWKTLHVNGLDIEQAL